MKRRNLSGIYIFEKFEDDEKRQPTCFEDCKEETQDQWLEGLEVKALKFLVKRLGKTIREIGEDFDIASD